MKYKFVIFFYLTIFMNSSNYNQYPLFQNGKELTERLPKVNKTLNNLFNVHHHLLIIDEECKWTLNDNKIDYTQFDSYIREFRKKYGDACLYLGLDKSLRLTDVKRVLDSISISSLYKVYILFLNKDGAFDNALLWEVYPMSTIDFSSALESEFEIDKLVTRGRSRVEAFVELVIKMREESLKKE